MTKLEKTIRGLECWVKSATAAQECDGDCPYRTTVEEEQVMGECNWPNLFRDALELLKEQEPRVLTLDEVRNGNEIGYVEFKYHWEEGWVKCDFTTHNAENEVIMMFSASKTFYQNTEDYGALWRIWSMEPTIEQRKAVKWDE